MQDRKISQRRNLSTLISSSHRIRIEEGISRKSLACSVAAFTDANRRGPSLALWLRLAYRSFAVVRLDGKELARVVLVAPHLREYCIGSLFEVVVQRMGKL